jgi:subtilisin family serine protease
VIGIVDYGIDYRLRAFQNMDGTTRIAYLWDQELEAEAPEDSPPKYRYGIEYTRAEIDLELTAQRAGSPRGTVVRHEPVAPQSDVSGHGTAVAGVAAGRGPTVAAGGHFHEGTYDGVAPGATLVFVHLDRRSMLGQVGDPGGTLSNSMNLIHGIAYCFERAEELNMPCVVNISMGFNGGGHDGNTAVEWIIDALLRKSGRAMVIAAGNENRADKRIYYRGTVPAGAPTAVRWEHGELQIWEDTPVAVDDTTPNEMEIWYSRDSELRVRLAEPSRWGEEASDWVSAGQFLTFGFGRGESVEITSNERTPWHGDARIHIRLSPGMRKGIRQGTWRVELDAVRIGPSQAVAGAVRIDAWIERTIPDVLGDRYLRSRFLDYRPDEAITITTPATARNAIAVASYDDKDEEDEPLSAFSGRGPTRTDGPKPDIAAPGNSVFSVNAGYDPTTVGTGSELVQKSGPSLSAPHVTGVVARLLSLQHYLFAAEIRELLGQSARNPVAPGTFDSRGWGRGKVDAAAALALLEDRIRNR